MPLKEVCKIFVGMTLHMRFNEKAKRRQEFTVFTRDTFFFEDHLTGTFSTLPSLHGNGISYNTAINNGTIARPPMNTIHCNHNTDFS